MIELFEEIKYLMWGLFFMQWVILATVLTHKR